MITIRFNYCPPNPGSNKLTKCKWFNNIDDAINNYDGHSSIWIKNNNMKFYKISYYYLIKMKNNV